MSGGFFERNLRVQGAPGFKFHHNAEAIAARREQPLVGHGVRGTVVDVSGEIQATNFSDKKPAFDKNNQPIMQIIVTIQTGLRNWENVTAIPLDDNDQPKPPHLDDGKRNIYIKNQMARAVAKALKEAGGQEQVRRGIVVGDDIAFKVSGYHDVGKGTPMVEFEAKYWIAPQNSGSFEQHLEQPAQQVQAPDPFAGQQTPAAAPSGATAVPAGGYTQPSAPAQQVAQQPAQDPWAADAGNPQWQQPANDHNPTGQAPVQQPAQQGKPIEAPF